MSASETFQRYLHRELRCAKCQTRVRAVERRWDGAGGATTFRVHCHGAVDEVTLPNEMIEAVHEGRASLDLSPAFGKPELPPAPPTFRDVTLMINGRRVEPVTEIDFTDDRRDS